MFVYLFVFKRTYISPNEEGKYFRSSLKLGRVYATFFIENTELLCTRNTQRTKKCPDTLYAKFVLEQMHVPDVT